MKKNDLYHNHPNGGGGRKIHLGFIFFNRPFCNDDLLPGEKNFLIKKLNNLGTTSQKLWSKIKYFRMTRTNPTKEGDPFLQNVIFDLLDIL